MNKKEKNQPGRGWQIGVPSLCSCHPGDILVKNYLFLYKCANQLIFYNCKIVKILCNSAFPRPAAFPAERPLRIGWLDKPAPQSQMLSQNELRACGDQGALHDLSCIRTACKETSVCTGPSEGFRSLSFCRAHSSHGCSGWLCLTVFCYIPGSYILC